MEKKPAGAWTFADGRRLVFSGEFGEAYRGSPRTFLTDGMEMELIGSDGAPLDAPHPLDHEGPFSNAPDLMDRRSWPGDPCWVCQGESDKCRACGSSGWLDTDDYKALGYPETEAYLSTSDLAFAVFRSDQTWPLLRDMGLVGLIEKVEDKD